MPAHFAVGQGGTAQHIPSAPLPKARQRHPAYKGNKPALLHIPGQERGYTIQHTRAHCQEQGHASNPCPRVLRWGRAAPLQVHPARKNHWPRAWRATPPPPCAFPAKGSAPRPAPHAAALPGRPCRPPPNARAPSGAASKSGQGNEQRPARSGTGRAPLESPGRLRKTAKDGTRRATPAGLTIPPCARYNRHSRISGGFRHVCGGRAGKPRPQV